MAGILALAEEDHRKSIRKGAIKQLLGLFTLRQVSGAALRAAELLDVSQKVDFTFVNPVHTSKHKGR